MTKSNRRTTVNRDVYAPRMVSNCYSFIFSDNIDVWMGKRDEAKAAEKKARENARNAEKKKLRDNREYHRKYG